MFAQVSERVMHRVRWVLTTGWLVLILSLLYDPWTAALTQPDHPWSPLRLTGQCIQVQGQCLVEEPYPIGATVFWGAVVPSGIFILLVFGHELWRRICPLSFLSQIPRALGWERQFKRENAQTGKVRYELAKVKPESWLGRNYLYFQFAYLFIGLCGRILFFNADRLVLFLWITSAIVFAIAVGYFYGGKSWCQYFCPMAPVQNVFSEPRGLMGSKAHMSESRITQSMCRTVTPEGKEQSACVACQSPCFDIDSERTYWDGLNKPEESFIRYSYLGLVVGYFVFYYLYAGNWDYYFSGVWNRDPNQLASLMSPGLYLFGHPIGIPKLFAVPFVLGAFTAAGYFLGKFIDTRAKAYARQHYPKWNPDLVQHRIFATLTFIAFNFFFIFAARPLILLTPVWVQHVYDLGLVFLSTMWLVQTWKRNADLYSRENLASRFRKQLEKLELDVSQYLDGRSLADLHTNEVYVLAKVLPGFNRETRHEAYKGVVREALEEGYVNSSSSLEVLRQMRQELGVSDDEHREVLEELGIEDPDLLNPTLKRSLENQIRLSGYKRSLERLISLQQRQPNLNEFDQLTAQDASQLKALSREYLITPQEEEYILTDFSPTASNIHKADYLLARLAELNQVKWALNQAIVTIHPALVIFLNGSIQHKQELIVKSMLATLESLKNDQHTITFAQTLKHSAPDVVNSFVTQSHWQKRLTPAVWQTLTQAIASPATPAHSSLQDTVSYLENLLDYNNPLVQAATLTAIAQLDFSQAQKLVTAHSESTHPLVQTVANHLRSTQVASALKDLPQLEELVYLSNTDLFHRLEPETLIALSDRAEVKTYGMGHVISDAGDTCRELLLLLEGRVIVQHQTADGMQVEHLAPGQMLDELEVLTRSNLANTILSDSDATRVLTIPVDAFDELLDRYPDMAPRVLELESQYLQKLVRSR
ncbi:MAG: cyclic nucleotide-binding domain-containing protein [Leptolyngbyaceae cyanobacterium bins.349]|nr:cyclic nucleotide-binding domain-containing protein [Leptolyngbyaceae cyanobacterium bins.349]